MKKFFRDINISVIFGAAIIIILPAIFCLFFGFPYIKGTKQFVDDFIVGETVYFGDNKTGEWLVLWLSVSLSVITAFVLALFMHPEKREYAIFKKEILIDLASRFLVILFCTWSFVTVISVYAGRCVVRSLIVLGISFLLFGILFLIPKSENIYKCLCLPVPVLLTVFLKNTYDYQGIILKLNHPRIYRLFFIGMIVLLIGCMFYDFFISKRRREGFDVPFSVCLSVFAFVSAAPAALMEQYDFHHHGEQILPFQQIFILGQRAYKDYYPSSGFYPVPIGAINHFLFKDSFNAYSLSYIIFMFIFEIALVYLLQRRIGGKLTLITVFVFHMPVYCRTWIISIAILILSDKALLKKKLTWLITWIFVCYLCGLYYPLFGAAVLLGSLPYGLMHVGEMLSDHEWTKKIKRSEIVYGISVLLIVLVSIPLLYRMFSHVVSMSSQTMLADSMAVMGKEIPEFFLPFLSKISELNRARLYYFLRLYLGVPFAGIGTFAAFLYIKKLLDERRDTRKFDPEKRAGLLLSLSIPIILVVSYTYTFVCMDEDWVARLSSRSAHVIILTSGILGIVFLKETGLKRFIPVCLLVPFLFFVRNKDYEFPRMAGITDEESFVILDYNEKFSPYRVSADYVPSDDKLYENYPFVIKEKFGNGFVLNYHVASINDISRKMDILREYDPEVKLVGHEESQVNYFLTDEKCVYSGKVSIAKGRDAAKVMTKKIDYDHTVVRSSIHPLQDYYLYRSLLDHDYVYAPDFDMFMPESLYEKIYDEKGSLENSVWTISVDTKMASGILGENVDNIKELNLSSKDLMIKEKGKGDTYIINAPKDKTGKNAEFLYIKLSGPFGSDGTIKRDDLLYPVFTVSWDGIDNPEYTVKGVCRNDELLIPLGCHADWYKRWHNNITIHFDGEEACDLKITKATFYNLKDL